MSEIEKMQLAERIERWYSDFDPYGEPTTREYFLEQLNNPDGLHSLIDCLTEVHGDIIVSNEDDRETKEELEKILDLLAYLNES